MSRLTFARLLLLLPSAAMALNNGVGLTPAMGYNTYQSPWSFQGGDALVIADALNVTGLQVLTCKPHQSYLNYKLINY